MASVTETMLTSGKNAVTYLIRGFRAALPARKLLDNCKQIYQDEAWSSTDVHELLSFEIQRSLKNVLRTVKELEFPNNNSVPPTKDFLNMKYTIQIQDGFESAPKPWKGWFNRSEEVLEKYFVSFTYATRFIRLYLQEIDNMNSDKVQSALAESSLVSTVATFTQALTADILVDSDIVDFQYVEWKLDTDAPNLCDLPCDSFIFRISTMSSDVAFLPWEAGMHLFESLVSTISPIQQLVQGKVVLELGAGIGSSAPALRIARAEAVFLTDVSQKVLQNIDENLQINDLIDYATPEIFNMENCKDLDLEAFAELADVVIGADITYSPELVTAVVQVYEALLSKRKRLQTGIIFATQRNEITLQQLVNDLEESDLTVTDITDEVMNTKSPCLSYLYFDKPQTVKVLKLEIK